MSHRNYKATNIKKSLGKGMNIVKNTKNAVIGTIKQLLYCGNLQIIQ